MSNKDMPAYPGNHKRRHVRDSNGDMLHTDEVEVSGLTKLEAFTMAALQGLLANAHPDTMNLSEDDIAAFSLKFAEAALAELEGRELNKQTGENV